MQIWNTESEGLLDIYADEELIVEYTHIQRIEGVSDYKKFLQSHSQSFPDAKVTVGEIHTDKKNEKVTLFWNFSGTHQKHTLFGVMPSGKPISVNGMTLLTIKDKKVVKEKGILDNLSLLMQLNKPE